jgi:hypothetical protein
MQKDLQVNVNARVLLVYKGNKTPILFMVNQDQKIVWSQICHLTSDFCLLTSHQQTKFLFQSNTACSFFKSFWYKIVMWGIFSMKFISFCLIVYGPAWLHSYIPLMYSVVAGDKPCHTLQHAVFL